MLFTTVMLIIVLSVFLHGLSSVPLVAAYSRWYAAHVTNHPSAPEEKPTIMSRLRHRPAPEEHHPAPEEAEPEETEPATAQQHPSK
jgi:sodium/hydrogen antiporter